MEVEAFFEPAVLKGISITMSADEAKRIKSFIGQTCIGTVTDLLPRISLTEAQKINDTLYEFYDSLEEYWRTNEF